MTAGLASIVLNNKDYADFLREAIDSALTQTYPEVEVVVVDDGSTDTSPAVIESYGTGVIAVLNSTSRGQPAALNLGVAASNGEFIFLLDADDVFVPVKIAEIVAAFQRHPEAGACFHGRALLTERGTKQGPPLELSGVADLRAKYRAGRAPFLSTTTSAMCFRREALDALLPMPELPGDSLGDHYLKWSTLATTPVIFDPRLLTLQRLHTRNRFTRKRDWEEDAEKQSLNALWLRRRIPGSRRFSRHLASEVVAQHLRHGARPGRSSALRSYLREAGKSDAINVVVQGGARCVRQVGRTAFRRATRRPRQEPPEFLL